MAAELRTDGTETKAASVVLTSGVGGKTYGVQGINNITVSFTLSKLGVGNVTLRDLVCDVKQDIIIGLCSIKFYNLLPILDEHINLLDSCKI